MPRGQVEVPGGLPASQSVTLQHKSGHILHFLVKTSMERHCCTHMWMIYVWVGAYGMSHLTCHAWHCDMSRVTSWHVTRDMSQKLATYALSHDIMLYRVVLYIWRCNLNTNNALVYDLATWWAKIHNMHHIEFYTYFLKVCRMCYGVQYYMEWDGDYIVLLAPFLVCMSTYGDFML